MTRLPVLLLGGCMMVILSGCDLVAAVRSDGSTHVRVAAPATDPSCSTPPAVSHPDGTQPAVRSGPSSGDGGGCVTEWSTPAGGGEWAVGGWRIVLWGTAGGWTVDARPVETDEESVGPFPGTVVLELSGRPLSYNTQRHGIDRRLVWQNPNLVRARWTAYTGLTITAAAVFMVGLAAVLFGTWKLRRQ